ncbi:phosphoethanolamine transferase [Stenotrophomonas sp.]|uniref:phosphoethanolamine transferase n=1 Tax=Stenotrophomonas sp. TaxID=69392 RepID=UPI0028AC0DC9|nr:phosphoethanolamine transferase [Stenotrophomonas sp.]
MFGSLPDDAPPSAARAALLASYPLGIPLLIKDYFVSREVVASAVDRRRAHKFGAKLVSGERSVRKIYVFVIGETGRGSRWQANGYSRPTTPRIIRRSDTIVFSRMSTPFVFTRLSVPAMLTRAGTRDSSHFNEGSLVAAFKEAGFRTVWISMQAPLGFHESMVSSYAAEADDVQFINPSDYAAKGLPDMNGVDALVEYVRHQPVDVNLFIVLHTLGSHFKYTDRYPLEDAYFLPDRPAAGRVSLYDPNDALYLSNAYDNSVRYTDKVLNSLFDRIQEFGGESWVYYSADHGEAIFDSCDGSSGHGQFNAETQSVAAAFWASPGYVGRNESRITNLRARAGAPLSTVMVFETLTGLAGLEMPGQRMGHDFSGNYPVSAPPPRRYASCEKPLE